ncbi:MAG: hypothetical protein WA364_18825 [Candidatus Nitrosopolaris sp.]
MFAFIFLEQHNFENKKTRVVLGVDCPEFTFEKIYTDVKAAVQRFGTPNRSLGVDGSFRIDGQRLYNLSIHNNYAYNIGSV